ncbi:hypothetical protein EOM82_00560 [bacterium]|nr:hypothetical protein [bacterium]
MKKITPKQKKILDIVVTVLQVALVVVAITISAIVIANPVISTNEVSKGTTKLLPVLTNSMDGEAKDSFAKGALVIAKKPKDVLSLEVGQIVTFVGTVNGSEALITHRIVEVISDEDGKAVTYTTHGDNNPEDMKETVNPYKVLAVYSSHLDGVGSAILWLQTPTNFLLVIVLPLVLLFVYNIIMFVRMIMQAKVEKVKEDALGTGSNVTVDEEEIKRKAIEEYLASQKKEDNSPENK